jgi:hypothetical protein
MTTRANPGSQFRCNGLTPGRQKRRRVGDPLSQFPYFQAPCPRAARFRFADQRNFDQLSRTGVC